MDRRRVIAGETKRDSDFVWGVVFDIDPAQKQGLDRAEGLGHGYSEKMVTVTHKTHKRYECVMYHAQPSHLVSDQPYSWYKLFVVEGALQHSLPQDYIDQHLAAPADKQDPEKARDARKRKIAC